MQKYRNVYRVEKVGSELTKEEEENWYEVVREAKRSELVGIMKHDAMRCVKKVIAAPSRFQVDGC